MSQKTNFIVLHEKAQILDLSKEADAKMASSLEIHEDDKFEDWSEAKSDLVRYWLNVEQTARKVVKRVKAL